MAQLILYNKNPDGRNVGDCTVRAIAEALSEDWEKVYIGLCLMGLELLDMPSANAVWGAYLRRNGFTRHILPNDCPEDYTVEQFAEDHAQGVYVVAVDGHVLCVRDGAVIDTWDSRQKIPIYYWHRDGQND